MAAAAGFAALSIVSASAQTATQPAGGGGGSATVKIAVIDSSLFSDEKGGITRVVSAMKTVDTQFQPQRTELQGLQDRYNTLVANLQKAGPVQDAKVTAQQTEQAEQLKVQIERKGQDAQASFQKRMQDVLGPLQEDVYTALQTYVKQRGISVVLDANRVPLIYVADSVDITREFVADYNRTHPATAASSRP